MIKFHSFELRRQNSYSRYHTCELMFILVKIFLKSPTACLLFTDAETPKVCGEGDGVNVYG